MENKRAGWFLLEKDNEVCPLLPVRFMIESMKQELEIEKISIFDSCNTCSIPLAGVFSYDQSMGKGVQCLNCGTPLRLTHTTVL